MQPTSKQTFAILPSDIILLIAEFLDPIQLRQCILVSIEWNAIFRPILYQTVKANSYLKFNSFYRTLEQPTKKQKNRVPRLIAIGSNVRTLHLEDGLMTGARMQQLGILCPNVTSVIYEWRHYAFGPTVRRVESPLTLFEHFRPSTLRTLSLQSLQMTSKPDSFASDILLPVLKNIPQLESLTMGDKMHFVTVDFMEQLHNICPRLKQLSIGGENIKKADDESVPMHAIKTVVPATSLESLAIPSLFDSKTKPSVWAEADVFTGPWFTYITHKYPALKRLAIPSSQYSLGSYGTPDRDTQHTPTITFRDFFPQLDELTLSVFANQLSTAWPQLVRSIPKILLCDNPRQYFSEWISHKATSNLEYLSMSTFPENLSDLKHCRHLQELELATQDFELTIETAETTRLLLEEYYEININVILSCCPTLKKLTVGYGSIVGDITSRTKTSLRTLILKNMVIKSTAALDHVCQRCPALFHLDLYCCTWVVPDTDPIIRINLPRLSYFRTVNPRVYRERPGSYYGDEQPTIASDAVVMVAAPTGNETGPERLHYGLGQRRVRQVTKTATICWLDNDPADNSARRQGDMEEDETLDSNLIERELVDRMFGFHSDGSRHAGTVLYCHSVDRLYYNESRLDLDPKSPVYVSE